MSTPTWTTGDTGRALSGVITSNGTAVDLTTATSASVHILRPDRTTIVRAAVIATGTTGAWSMAWQATDLTIGGPHHVEVQVTWADTTIETFADDTFQVRDQIA